MRITLITPGTHPARTGNQTTATRWARLLREAGHRTTVVPHDADDGNDQRDSDAEVLIALHAWRTHSCIRAFSERHPERPLIVALTGTDVYRFQHTEPDVCLDSMTRAHVLIGLHERLADDIPAAVRGKVHTVLQSAQPLPASYGRAGSNRARARAFRVIVVGHLRDEKDPLRAALAVRAVPAAESRVQVVNVGRALASDWAAAAEAEAARNPRFAWQGEAAPWQVRRMMARAHLMVISSVMEGGANVISEACVAGLPVLASDIAGNRGLLGDAYPGYFPAEDTSALRKLLLRAERDELFYARLAKQVTQLAPRFHPAAEQASLQQALATARRRISRNKTATA